MSKVNVSPAMAAVAVAVVGGIGALTMGKKARVNVEVGESHSTQYLLVKV